MRAGGIPGGGIRLTVGVLLVAETAVCLVGLMIALQESSVQTADGRIAVATGGSGPAVLLLHGFPESKRMWKGIASIMSSGFSVVTADLRGYGDSGTPPTASDHVPYSKRVMASEMRDIMHSLGHEQFFVAGHDRGGRVAYRMALDHPAAVRGVAVLDVLPVDFVWDHADDRMALGFWPWSLLAQDPPLPERILTAASVAIIDAALGPGWGTPADTFDADDRSAYAATLADPAHAHAICEEYRAGSTLDRDHDEHDRNHGRRIVCPLLALWSDTGPLDEWYTDSGGPLQIWRGLANTVTGRAVPGGHFFPEEHPEETAETLSDFFAGCPPIA